MSIERTYYCQGPGCGGDDGPPVHVRTVVDPPYLPGCFLEVRTTLCGREYRDHFCSWDCLMKHAAKQPVPERIDL